MSTIANPEAGVSRASRFRAAGKRLLSDLWPLLAVSGGYPLLRFAVNAYVTAPRVVNCGIRSAELALFSVGPDTTFGEALAQAHTPILDVLCAVPYAAFIYIVFGYAAYLFFRDRERMRRFVLAFAIANYIAFVFWLLLPVAPPWYTHAHGCAVQIPTAPSAAGLLRVDALIGYPYFANFYSHASQVFGAMPSLHCAYPLVGLLSAWKVAPLRFRVVHVVYCAWMAFSAMYLDHHWLLDVMAGWCVAVVSLELAKLWLRKRAPVTDAILVNAAPAKLPVLSVSEGGGDGA